MTENEIRITSETGGQKGTKQTQWSLVNPHLRYEAVCTWADPIRRNLGIAMIRFEQGHNGALTAALTLAIELLVRQVGGINNAVTELSRQYGYGGQKYDRGNWRLGYPWSLSVDAFWRHLLVSGEIDEESGCSHAAAVLWHVYCLIDFVDLDLGTDDRLWRPRQSRCFDEREAELVSDLFARIDALEEPPQAYWIDGAGDLIPLPGATPACFGGLTV